jgi:hypothetical protein
MQITPAHIAGGFVAGAALTGSATIASAYMGKDRDLSPLVLAPAMVGVTGLTGGLVYGNKLWPTNPMLATAVFATGLGLAGGFTFSLPVAVGIAQSRP